VSIVVLSRQLKALEQVARRRFEEDMLEHCKDFSPRLCGVLGDEQVRSVIRSAMVRAEAYGLTNRGPVRLFIELAFLCGSGFDTDPQYAAIGQALHGRDEQMRRADGMYLAFVDYLDRVCGPENRNVDAALENLLEFARQPVAFAQGFGPGMLGEIAQLFPQKAAYVGEAGLKGLILEAIAEARRYHFSTQRQGALLVALMFAFGHRCTDDPLYPWIARTLNDPRIVDATARAERLERKAVTWLEHVLGRRREGPDL
jgi:hypothetical protein